MLKYFSLLSFLFFPVHQRWLVYRKNLHKVRINYAVKKVIIPYLQGEDDGEDWGLRGDRREEAMCARYPIPRPILRQDSQVCPGDTN